MPAEWVAFIREFGLPLTMLAAFAWAILRRKLVTGAEADGWKALYERERQDRVAAEAGLVKFAPATAEVAEAVAELSKTVLERLPASKVYDERLGVRRGR